MATQDDYREAVKARYEFSAWSGRVKGDPDATRKDVKLPETPVEGWILERVDPIGEGGERVEAVDRYLFRRRETDGRERVMVRLYQYPTVLAAHEGLIDVVMTFMATSLPRCASVGTEAGDVCFGSPGDVQTGTLFARYNVLVQVESIGADVVSVSSLVQAIDALLA